MDLIFFMIQKEAILTTSLDMGGIDFSWDDRSPYKSLTEIGDTK